MDCEDGVEKVRVEEVSEARGRNGRYGRGLVGEGRDEEDGFEGQVVGFCAWDGRVPVLKVVGEALD